jgi:hypothetical protein
VKDPQPSEAVKEFGIGAFRDEDSMSGQAIIVTNSFPQEFQINSVGLVRSVVASLLFSWALIL